MRVPVPFGVREEFLEVPDSRQLVEVGPTRVSEDPLATPAALTARLHARAATAGFLAQLDDLANRPAGTLLVLVDDITRVTPVCRVLPWLLDEIRARGLDPARVQFLVALGTHRPMTPAELEQKFGTDVVTAHEFFQHQWQAEADLVHVGTVETPEGPLPVTVNRALEEAALTLGVGNVVPHRVTGFSGGYKIVIPGVSCEETVGMVHWLSARFASVAITGQLQNPVRDLLHRAGRLTNLQFVLQTVLDVAGTLVEVHVGDPVEAHARAARQARGIYAARAPKSHVVVTDTVPESVDFWVGAKGLVNVVPLVKPGGTLVCLSPCREGLAPTHPEIERLGYHPHAEVARMLADGRLAPNQRIVASHLAHVGDVLQHCEVALYSTGIPAELARRLGFRPFPDPQAALDHALRKFPGEPRVVFVRRGAEVLPLPIS